MIEYLFKERVKKNDEYFKIYAPKNEHGSVFKVKYFKQDQPLGEFYLPKINRHLEFDALKTMVGAA